MQELDSRLVEISQLHSPTPTTRHLILAAAATALGSREVTLHVLRRCLADGAAAEALREAILQTYLFAGYPRAINALAELTALRPHAGSEAPALDLTAELGRDRRWLEDGQALCRRVYGAGYERLLPLMARLSPDLGRWMILEGYGKVLSRPGLDAPTRELCAVGALVVLHVPVQLRAHIRGSRFVGASRADVAGTLRTAAALLPAALEPALALLDEVEDDRPAGT